ncbi:MAG: peptidase S15, partial [Actinobacteria bacterium]|nr:peptidase S15 [Actinomycetota bacterium]
EHRFADNWHRARSADWPRVHVPFLTAANWGGQGLHPRGNFAGFTQAASTQKWLEVHGDAHWTHFYTDYGLGLQRAFFDHFLKGIDNGWDRRRRVTLNVRHPGERFEVRMEDEWPLARTDWQKWHLDLANGGFLASPGERQQATYHALGDGVTLTTAPLAEPMEITGPLAAKLFISSSTRDADFFLIVRVFDPAGSEVVFMGALDPCTPIAQGWLRASHRQLDPERSRFYQPYHPHQAEEPLTPGEICEVDIEILPTCIVVPAGYRVALTIRGRDYQYGGELPAFAHRFYYASRGVGPFTHTGSDDRPPEVFGGDVTIHAGAGLDSYLLVPVIPARAG